jgi:hypothetical protein
MQARHTHTPSAPAPAPASSPPPPTPPPGQEPAAALPPGVPPGGPQPAAAAGGEPHRGVPHRAGAHTRPGIMGLPQQQACTSPSWLPVASLGWPGARVWTSPVPRRLPALRLRPPAPSLVSPPGPHIHSHARPLPQPLPRPAPLTGPPAAGQAMQGSSSPGSKQTWADSGGKHSLMGIPLRGLCRAWQRRRWRRRCSWSSG